MRHKRSIGVVVVCLLGTLPFALTWIRRLPDYRKPGEPFQRSPVVRQRIDSTIEDVAVESLDHLVTGAALFDDYFEGSFRYQGPGESGRIRFPLLFASRRFLRILEHLDSLSDDDARRECHRIRAAWLEGHRQTIEACLRQYMVDGKKPPASMSAVGAYMGLVASAFVTANYCGVKDAREWLETLDKHSATVLDRRNMPPTTPDHARTMLANVTRFDPLLKINMLYHAASHDSSVDRSRLERIDKLLVNLQREEMAINGWDAKVGVFNLAAINQGAWPEFDPGETRVVVAYGWGNAVVGNTMYITDEGLRGRVLGEVEAALAK